MTDAAVALLMHIVAAALLVAIAAYVLVSGVAKTVLLLFTWPMRVWARR